MPYIIISGSLIIAMIIIRVAIVGRVEPLPGLEIAHAQSIGNREIMADAFQWAVSRDKTLLILADGIGSGTRGRTAALSATDSMARTFELQGLTTNPAYFFKQAFQNANEAVLRYIPDSTAGASLLGVFVSDGTLYYALAGSCKIMVFRNGELISLSEGQTLDVLAKDAYRKKEISREEAIIAAQERRLYNFVGKDDFKAMETSDIPVRLKEGDYIVLMTAGVYDFCPTLDLESILRERGNVRNKAQNIIDVIISRGDPEQDNATVVLAKVNRIN